MIRMFLVFALLGGFEFAHAQSQSLSSTMRRTYPGGKDDSDLTVQPLRKITRKNEELDTQYQGHVEPVEEDAAPQGPNQQGE